MTHRNSYSKNNNEHDQVECCCITPTHVPHFIALCLRPYGDKDFISFIIYHDNTVNNKY